MYYFATTPKNLYLTSKNPFMPHSTYRALPLEVLYELLASSVRDMLVAFDSKHDNVIAFSAVRQQVEIILQIIAEKKKEESKISG